MAEKTGSNHSWQPMLGATSGRVLLLGELLRLRRAALGYRHVPQFVRDRKINTRMVGDIEHGRRDTYTFPTLEDVAAAYEVTYMSMMAVVWSDASELVPAEAGDPVPAVPAPVTDPLALPPSPFADPDRNTADRPYALAIWKRYLDLPKNVTDPDGARMFPGDPDDAKAWDAIADMDIGDRPWVVGDLQRRADGRAQGSGTGTTVALTSRAGMMGPFHGNPPQGMRWQRGKPSCALRHGYDPRTSTRLDIRGRCHLARAAHAARAKRRRPSRYAGPRRVAWESPPSGAREDAKSQLVRTGAAYVLFARDSRHGYRLHLA